MEMQYGIIKLNIIRTGGFTMRKSKRIRQGLSLGTIVMFILTFAVVAGFSVLLPSFTGNQDILFDATRLAVAMDHSLAQLSASTGEIIQNCIQPQSTFLPPFASQTSARTRTVHYPFKQQPLLLSLRLPQTSNVPSRFVPPAALKLITMYARQ